MQQPQADFRHTYGAYYYCTRLPALLLAAAPRARASHVAMRSGAQRVDRCTAAVVRSYLGTCIAGGGRRAFTT
eukprot:COSAG01_NODE_43111_length_433_cov_0.802395_1_plen_72_part_10